MMENNITELYYNILNEFVSSGISIYLTSEHRQDFVSDIKKILKKCKKNKISIYQNSEDLEYTSKYIKLTNKLPDHFVNSRKDSDLDTKEEIMEIINTFMMNNGVNPYRD